MAQTRAWGGSILAGLLLAGVLVPLTFLLPERWQGLPLLLTVAGLCVAAAILVGRRRCRKW